MKHKLVEWLCIDFTNFKVMSLNLGRHKLSFIFVKILFGMNEKDQETLVAKEQIERLENNFIMVYEWQLKSFQCQSCFLAINHN